MAWSLCGFFLINGLIPFGARQAVSRLTPLCAGEESGDALRMSPLFKQGNAQVSQT